MRSTILALALVLAACGGPAQKPGGDHPPGYIEKSGDLLLTVNGETVTSNMVDAATRLTPKSEIERLKGSGGWVQLVEQVGFGEVLYQDAIRKGLHKDPGMAISMQMAIREVLAQENFNKQVNDMVTEAGIQKYYDDRAVQYKREQAHARHILVREESKAKEIMDQLANGADFAQLVKENTLDEATKDKGGDLGFFNKKMLDPTVAKVAFEGEMNKPIGPIETRFGFHVFEVLERRDIVPLEDVREEIVGKMRQEAAETVMARLKADLTMERHGELAEIYAKTANWGTADNPMGKTPPPERPGADPNLPGVRKGSDDQPAGQAPGPHGPH